MGLRSIRVLGVLLLLGASMTAYAQTSLTPQQVVMATNDVRQAQGLTLLAEDSALSRAAQARARDMAQRNYFSHRDPEGEYVWPSVRKQGYAFTRVAENIAVNYESADAVLKGWLDSSGHRANIMDDRFRDIGVGVAEGVYKGDSAYYVVQIFGTENRQLSQVAAASDVMGREERIASLLAEIRRLQALLNTLLTRSAQ